MSEQQRTIAVVTGTRAEFGLLRPVMRAISQHPRLVLRVIVCGTHLLPPQRTMDEVAAEFPVSATIELQREATCGRSGEAEALGRGISGFAALLSRQPPDVVLVLGDRIEAFAAVSAACVAGILVAHMHGGDRAEGIADEALRHAITKLAHIHLPATEQSAHRIIAMGEDPQRVHIVGSPAIDGLEEIPQLDDAAFDGLGRPDLVLLLHPAGGTEDEEQALATAILDACHGHGRVLALHPNHDPGRDGIRRAIEASGVESRAHLPRSQFVGLLKRVGLLVGNSSAGLIECAAIGARAVNIGSRQAGRERCGNVIDVPKWNLAAFDGAVRRARREGLGIFQHPYGDGRTGARTAELLATFDPQLHRLAKRNTY